MAKKKNSKEKKTPKKVEKKEDSSSPKEGFDFGGMPDRDLKKNLGCG